MGTRMRIILSIILFGLIACNSNKPEDNISKPPVSKGSAEPSLTITGQGLLLSWCETTGDETALKMSVFQNNRWSEPNTIAKGNDWFVNWADFPAIVANGDHLFAHFLQKSESGTYTYDVMYTLSGDMGKTWSEPRKLHQDTVSAEHGFVSAVPFKDGFMVSWLDGRYTINKGAMTVRAAYLDLNGQIQNSWELDHRTCDCCQTSMTMAGGKPVVYYRDRSEEEIRDIYFAVFDDTVWAKPTLLNDDNWEIKGCPVNGPRASSIGDKLAVVWFSGAGGEHKVKMKISSNGGMDFNETIRVDGPNALGRVDVQMDDENIYVSYLNKSDKGAALMLKTYNQKGEFLKSKIMAYTSPERASGFPRMVLWDSQIVVTWTDVEGKMVKVVGYVLQ
jgi:BNR repeat-like domain